jgi:uncharacterized protein (TIGR02145 family)
MRLRLFIHSFPLLISLTLAGCNRVEESLPVFFQGSTLIEATRTSAVIETGASFEGSFPVTACGVCWSTAEYPTQNDPHTADGNGSGAFTSTISGLAPNTLYYLRPYATSKAGTGYGDLIYVKTKAGEVTDIDGNVYSTIISGNMEWMAENLKTTRFSDGAGIPLVTDPLEWSMLSTPAYCLAGNSSAEYGALYNWYAVKTGKLCPEGWHISTLDEWYSLVYPFDKNLQANMESKSAGCDLAKPGIRQFSGCPSVAPNKSGLSAIAGSFRSRNGEFSSDIKSSRFWLPEDKYNSYFAEYMYVSCGCSSKQTSLKADNKGYGYSVRCVKD